MLDASLYIFLSFFLSLGLYTRNDNRYMLNCIKNQSNREKAFCLRIAWKIVGACYIAATYVDARWIRNFSINIKARELRFSVTAFIGNRFTMMNLPLILTVYSGKFFL